ncbi:DUF6264 family protein [Cryobacterium tepidiphilum]|uniref:DUF6264 family protein n=1 Tax=Cryobacterium tepidiphilum TaxID=2486026 RepID=UPI001F482DD3|nr:DUF6264 family protein [Cryobacterium tepidiphilum]
MSTPDGTPPPGTPPEDRRPRPQFGELAPEGWSWRPPQPEAPAPAPSSPPPPVGGVPRWDRPVTLVLLILGLLGATFAASVLVALPDAVQLLYTQQNLGTYVPAASVEPVLTIGMVLQGLTWLATAGVSVWLLVRGRRAFYVPVIGAAVSLVALFVVMSIALSSDPTLLDFYSRP